MILALSPDFEGFSVEKLHEAITCPECEVAFIVALPVQFRRIDVGNPDPLAIDDEAVAIVHASNPDAISWADSEGK
ncbi:hypothetical protein GCM10023208_21520 [Erythrobacter westpacificensis]|uniref:Uncharacterized protein n=1 Tax=Erythrobacter westpacificensis TaxID=1055231 RepID=A0ABP9KH31_9SPHN